MKPSFLDTHSLSAYLPYEAYQDHLFITGGQLVLGLRVFPLWDLMKTLIDK